MERAASGTGLVLRANSSYRRRRRRIGMCERWHLLLVERAGILRKRRTEAGEKQQQTEAERLIPEL